MAAFVKPRIGTGLGAYEARLNPLGERLEAFRFATSLKAALPNRPGKLETNTYLLADLGSCVPVKSQTKHPFFQVVIISVRR
jgi:hypothetical protein